MRTAYFDCFSGISGDMTLSALIDAGLSLKELKLHLSKLPIDNYDITARKVKKNGIATTKVDVIVKGRQRERRLSDIKKIINNSKLDKSIKNNAINIFERLAKAEAKVHKTSINNVHFHEVGAVDAIVDITGAVIGLKILGIENILASAINTGTGYIKSAHGILPVPGPATAELLKNIPIYSTDIKMELTTPTGAAIISTLASDFGPMPKINIKAIGYGAGTFNSPDMPNLLRIFIGEMKNPAKEENTILLETNIDDMNPQLYEYVTERLFAAGALDVYLTPIIMKKGRPATMLSVLTTKDNIKNMADILFRETTSIGMRVQEIGRIKVERKIKEIKTKYGKVRVKIAFDDKEILGINPEYEDCKRIAIKKGIPLKKVMEEIRKEAGRIVK
ncbi:MAG: nickel pincer cofactor biosynthesis protein LarC [Nitrospirae bacterium]|nr:nickel pincer cofactor biosynthesis protein LarC [Nitrospirota bacterium]